MPKLINKCESYLCGKQDRNTVQCTTPGEPAQVKNKYEDKVGGVTSTKLQSRSGIS